MSEGGIAEAADDQENNERTSPPSSSQSHRTSLASIYSSASIIVRPVLYPLEYLGPMTIYLLRLIRDVLAFFIRGGLSTLMFFMDLVLGFFIFVFDTALHLPGAHTFGHLFRFLMWCFQTAMWVVYTSLELLMYLPVFYLGIYIVCLCLAYLKMPGFIDTLLDTMFWLSKTFLRILKNLVYDYTDLDEVTFPEMF